MESPDLSKITTEELQAELQRREIEAPTIQQNIDWSSVISTAQDFVKDIQESTYFDSEDSKQYIWEEVMKALYGKDFFKWYNKNT